MKREKRAMVEIPGEYKQLKARADLMESALKVIWTWAHYRDGELLTPGDVLSLCETALGRGKDESKG